MTIKEMMAHLQFHSLTPIQEAVMNHFDQTGHIVGLAPTGTGKTHAYLFPLLANIKRTPNTLEAMIILPTNELVLQVERMLKETDQTVEVRAIYGSLDMEKETHRIKKAAPNILITTPAKLHELFITRFAVQLKDVQYVVLDEADMMFDKDFLSMIDPVFVHLEVDKFLLFSASLTQNMEPFIKKYFGAFLLLDTSKASILNITYPLISVQEDRLDTLGAVLKRINPYLAIIFVSRHETLNVVFEYLYERDYDVVSFSSQLSIRERKRILEDIHALKYQYVVASDLLSRGIDFKASHIIHYDLPYQLPYFKHRSGRTGRMGEDGVVITLFDVYDRKKIDRLRNQGIPFEPYQITKDRLKPIEKRTKTNDKEIIEAMKRIPKPKKVKPNYKKKHAQKVKEAVKKIKKERYKNAHFRKSRGS